MYKKILAVAPFLLSGVQAKPCLTCTPDSCYAAARQTGIPGLNAKEDCSAFMRTTITPATSYFTASVTAVQTFDVTDIFTTSNFDTATQTDTTSVTTSETSFSTISSILATQTDNFAVTITQTETQTTTSTQTNTFFTTITGAPVPNKRSVPLPVKDLLAQRGAGLRKRSVQVANGGVPAYATDVCTDAKAYSSACRCNGVRTTTITAAVPTATLTVTNSASVTQTSQSSVTLSLTTTATQTQTQTITQVVTEIVTVPLTSTISQTSTSTATETTTTGVTETTATTATSTLTPAPTSGVLRVSGSQFDGQYARVAGGAEDRTVSFGARSVATTITLDANKHLQVTADGGIGNTNQAARDVLYFNTAGRIAQAGYAQLECTAAAGTGILSCTRTGYGAVFFTTCNDMMNTVVISTTVDAGCTAFNYIIEKP
ncbi:hypothetical protein PGQ11_014593 [Apiospora arundinis]|uniref:Uncharacterized protein n=1 Tax=Apiospora arundinis TaxID=335852 RepID=A0ABR2HU34_9PEZI